MQIRVGRILSWINIITVTVRMKSFIIIVVIAATVGAAVAHRESLVHKENLAHRAFRVHKENLAHREFLVCRENLAHRETGANGYI